MIKRFTFPFLLICTAWLGMAIFPTAYADPLVSCLNIGISDGSYTITGTTTNICAGCTNKTTADANALVTSPGDAILFKAGETFNIGSEGNRLNTRPGVLYGRYDIGPNPIISSLNVPFSLGFRGIIDVLTGDDDVTIDGIDTEGWHDETVKHFSIYVHGADNITVSNLTVRDAGAGLMFLSVANPTTNIIVDKVVITNIRGAPHESITFDGADGFVVSNIRSHNNDHAAIDMKGGSTNGEIFGSEWFSTTNDPVFYLERATFVNVHDNWIHDAVGTFKPLMSVGIENFGADNIQVTQNHEIHNNVLENTQQYGFKIWIKNDVLNTPGQNRVNNINFHNNTIVNAIALDQAWQGAMWVNDDRAGGDLIADWSNVEIKDNIWWETHSGHAGVIQTNLTTAFDIDFNLLETGDTYNPAIATNTVFTGTPPFVDLANKNFDPAGAALGAGTGGGDIGANITWTCGLGTTPPPEPTPDPLTPLQTAKPDPYTIDNLETHYPDHLWVFSDEVPAGTIDDEGGGTVCDLVLTGPDSASDVFGKYYSFIAANSDIALDSSCTPPVTTGVMCAIIRQVGAPIGTQNTIMSFGEAADAFQGNILDFMNGTGFPRSAILPVEGSDPNFNDGPWSATDGNINMVCARQSATVNEVWMNDSGWQPTVGWSGFTTWTGADQFAVGALVRTATTQYLDGDVYTAFMFNATKTDAEMTTIWNSGDPWDALGIDPTAGGEPVVPATNEKLKLYD